MSIINNLGVPEEATASPTVTICPDSAKIEGRCRVLEYGDENVLFKCRRSYIRVFGKSLEISSMDAQESNLHGKISGVTISERREK